MGDVVSVAIGSKRVHFLFSIFLAPRYICSHVSSLYRCSINTCRVTKGQGEGIEFCII